MECLVTKLKGSVDNNQLPVYDGIKVKASFDSAGEYNRMSISYEGGTMSVLGGAKVYTSYADAQAGTNGIDSDATIFSSTKTYYFGAGDTYLVFKTKSKIAKLIVGGSALNIIPGLEALGYLTNLTELNLNANINIKGNIQTFGTCISLTKLRINGCTKITGNIDTLKTCTNLTEITAYGTAIGGTIEELGSLTSLKTLYIYDTDVDGEITTLATRMAANRTSGYFEISGNNKVTLDGVALARRVFKYICFGSSMPNPTSEETTQGWCVRDQAPAS